MNSLEILPSNYAVDTTAVPLCVDLFAGAGGLTLGFAQEGGIPLAAVDHDEDSTETYRRMFPMCREVYCGDIEKWHPKTDLSAAHVIIGGPPCQGFSLARGQRFVDDPRNHLFKYFVSLVQRFQPQWIVMENVQGITNLGGGVILRQIYEDFEDIGYLLDHRVVNMADYGVPQSRKRAILVGNRLGKKFHWPQPTHASPKSMTAGLFGSMPRHVSIRDAIGDLPWPMGPYFAHRANSQMRGPRNRHVDVDPAFTLRVRGDEFALCEHPASGAFAPDPLPDVPFAYRAANTAFQTAMRELAPPWMTSADQPEISIDRPPALKGTRRLAVREQARLQGFPDWFTFSGRPYSQSRQIGNAVPPPFARRLFRAILSQSVDPERRERSASSIPQSQFKEIEIVRR